MSPSSGVLKAVVFMLPFGSCSALLIVCMLQRVQTINKALHEPNGSINTTACNTPDDGLMKARNM